MSGAPSSSEFASPTPAQADVSADAALILAALGRMEAVVRDERAAFTRLRVMLGDMAQAIARAKTLADSETAATLLDELEHRVDAMIDIAGGHHPVAEAAATPDPQPPSAAPVERDDAPLAQHAGATSAPDAGAAAQAIQHPAEQVPTVSDVVSRLGPDDETPPAAAEFPPVADTGIGAPTVAMLTAMVEALRDSISTTAPAPEAALESPTPQAAEVVAQPLGLAPQDLAPQPETSSIASAEAATPTIETAEAAEAAHTIEVAEATDIPAPADATPDNSAFVAMLRARLDALNAAAAAAALEPDAPVAEIAGQPLDVTPQPETSSIESAEVPTPIAEIAQVAEAAYAIEAPQTDEAPETIAAIQAAEIPPPAEAAPDNSAFVAMLNARLAELKAAEAAHLTDAPQAEASSPSEAIHTADVAAAAPIPGPTVTDLHESALLASLEQMGARPFPPPDEGTAVIFSPRPEFEFLQEFAPEPTAPAETAPAPEQAAAPLSATESAAIEQTVLAQTAAESQHAPPHAIEPEPAPAETTMAEILSDLARATAPAPALPAAPEIAAPDAEPTTRIEPAAEPTAAMVTSDAMAAAETTESDFDPADFLFEPEPEPDPAAFLLDPAPPAPATKAAVRAQPEFVAPPAKPAAKNPETLPPAESDPPAQKGSEPAPHDPLRALKAMSENEKLALFS